MGTLNAYTSNISQIKATVLVDLARLLGDGEQFGNVEFFRLDFIADNELIERYARAERMMTFTFASVENKLTKEKQFYLLIPAGDVWHKETVHVPKVFLGDKTHRTFDDENIKHKKIIGWVCKMKEITG